MMPQRNMHPFSACSNSVLSPNNSRGGGEQERFVLGIYLVGHTRGAGRANKPLLLQCRSRIRSRVLLVIVLLTCLPSDNVWHELQR